MVMKPKKVQRPVTQENFMVEIPKKTSTITNFMADKPNKESNMRSGKARIDLTQGTIWPSQQEEHAK